MSPIAASPPRGLSPRKALITTYIRDVFRTGSLTPSNPLLEFLQQPAASSAPILPNWSAVRPHHLQEAAQSVQQDLVAARKELTSKQSSLTDWKEWSGRQANLYFVTQSSALLSMCMMDKEYQSTSGLVNDSLLAEDRKELLPVLENLIATGDHDADKEDLVNLLHDWT